MSDRKRKSESQETLEKLLKRIKAIEDDVSSAIVACAGQSDDGSEQNEQDGGNDAENIEDGQENPQVPDDADKENQGEGEASAEKVDVEVMLDEDALRILGEDPTSKTAKSLDLPSSLSTRWAEWLKSGIKKEEKEEILAKYARQGTISLDAPSLNQELLVFLNEAAKKRDRHFCATQNLAGTALSSLSCALKQILFGESQPVDRLVILEELSDTAKLLIEIHRVQSKARIAYIIPSVSKEFRAILEKTTPDNLLFGTDLANKIKDAKEVAKIGKDYKPTGEASQSSKKSYQKAGSLNARDPFQKAGQSGPGQNQKSFTNKNRFMNWSPRNQQGQSKTPFRPNNRFNQ